MYFLEYLLFLFFEKLIPIFPLRFWQFIARLNAYFFYYILPIRKSEAYENLALAFPQKPKKEINQIIKECYINVLTVIYEFFYLRKFSAAELKKFLDFTNLELVDEKLKLGKGLIIVSAHYGNWELTAYGASRLFKEPVYVIVKEQANKRVDDCINRIRTAGGNTMIEMKNALREVLTALKNNKVIAMLGDQAAPKENVKVDFFLKNVPTFEGAARFAIKTGAAMLFGVSVRDPKGNYSVTFHEIDISNYKEATDENVRSLTQQHVNILIEFIKAKPGHWLWFHRRFKNRDA